MTATPESPAATSGDWWVTAGQSLSSVKERDAAARTAPDLLATLTELAQLRRAADTALGAAVSALLAAGRDWDDIAQALNCPDTDTAQHTTSHPLTEARHALDERLGHE